MKFLVLLATLSLATIFNVAYAIEAGSDDETLAYCNEQAQRDGVEDADEKNQYIKDCVDSFAAPAGDYQKPDQ